MKILISCFGLAICAALLCGCEWTAGGNVDSWNTSQKVDAWTSDSMEWADFSGTYKASGGGVLVKAYAVITSTNQVVAEQLGVGDGSKTAFSGNLGHSPVRSTLTIVVGGYRFTDAGTASTNTGGTIQLAVAPSDGTWGTFNFGTYIWTLEFPAPIAAGTQILADYYYNSTSEEQGNHGKAIYSFVVYQMGSKIQIIDSNGSRYDGNIGNLRLTGDQPVADETGKVVHNGPVEAQFSATGTSQGYQVTIVGVLQGTIAAENLSGRTMKATYIEEAGAQADINASAQ